MRESDVKSFSAEAKSAYQHFVTKKEYISDEYHMHVFKAAMLLIAVMSSGNVSNLYSQATQRKVSSTRSTLYKCFAGMLTKEDINGYLNDLVEIGVLRLDDMTNGDARLQIPYSGGVGDVFEYRKQQIIAKYTRYELFKKNGIFAKAIEAKIADKNDAAYTRLYIAAASSETSSISNRLDEIRKEMEKFPWRFGILVIAIDEASKFSSMQERVKALAGDDTTGRLAVCLLKSPLTSEHLDRWYNAKTHSELASDEGKTGDADRYTDEAAVIVSEWSEAAGDDQIMAVCGPNTYPNEYGAYSLIADLKKDIIFGKVFTAAPERFVTTYTAFKRMQASTAEYGVKKEEPNNAQTISVVNGLKTVHVWDVESLPELAQASGSVGADAIAAIANYILQKFAQGTQIKLDEMWLELQRPPYGYYNCIACGYILGYVLRFYINSEFSWNRGDNNPWPFTEKNIATMITDMCDGKTVNHYLSPGSEVWQKFKPYAQKVFKLSDGEVVNDTEARKYISKQCTEKAGVPFWVLKYVPEDQFGGALTKSIANEIVTLFCNFMSENGNQESVMGDIITKCTGNGKIRSTLSSLYFDQDMVYAAFGEYISQKCPELQGLRIEIGLTNRDMFDAIHRLMQGQVSTWTEQQVEEKLEELCIEYRAVAALNKALSMNRKSIKQLSDDIKNAFDNMIVPGSVIEEMAYDWIPTLRALHVISTTQWSKIEVDIRNTYTKVFGENASKVWGNVTSAKVLLKRYMDDHGNNCTEEELSDIFAALKPSKYDSSVTDFDNKISSQLSKIAYNRNKARINELWLQQSGFPTVVEWCNNYAVPVQWVVSDEEQKHITVLHDIQEGNTVNNVLLQNATQYFESHVVVVLKDKQRINDRFIANVGESYRAAFNASATILVSRLKTNKELTSDVYSWANKVGKIRNVIDEFLRIKYCDDAKKKVTTMKEDVLRDKVITLLEQNPDLYTLFIN